jgi:hypothetical protein
MQEPGIAKNIIKRKNQAASAITQLSMSFEKV